MKNDLRSKMLIAFVALILLWLVIASPITPAAAQSGGGYNLSFNAVAGGGATFATGGTFSVGSTVGQSGAGTSSGGSFSLNGGFW